MKAQILIPVLVSSIILISCQKDTEESPLQVTEDIQNLVVPSSFDFKTERKVALKLADDPNAEKVKYTIYASFDRENEELIATAQPVDGVVDLDLVIPDFCDQVKVVRNENGSVTTKMLSAAGNSVLGSFKRGASATQSCNEILYAVNGQGGFYTLNVEDGTYSATTLPNLVGGGSIACAVNKADGIVYYNTGTTLRYYDYNTNTFHVAQQGNPFNGSYPRMEYNPTNDLLYIAKNEDMHVINPLTNVIESSYDIVGLEDPVGGGDVAISENGTIYMCCFSGLYRIDINGNIANATRISAENLPFQPTSMAIDRNDRLYLATNDANSQLIEMDKFDGAWSVVSTYPHKINDLGSYKCAVSELANVDSDGDGVIDQLDDYPNDSEAAHTTYTPSDIGWGSLAFEDLWPSSGDYDFNDLVVRYRFTHVLNAQNKTVRMLARFQIKAIGASFHNGFGFKLDVNPALIQSVTGYNHTDGIVTVNSKGLEVGHSDGATIIVFDDAFNNAGQLVGGSFVNTQANQPEIIAPEMEITIEFTNPIDPAVINSVPPYNPFIFIDGDRGRELHLADMVPTDLADPIFFGTVHDMTNPSSGVYYRTANNLPWGINMIHEFRHPLEKVPINSAYNFFSTWGVSGGNSYKDWYKDNAGYRNANRLYLK